MYEVVCKNNNFLYLSGLECSGVNTVVLKIILNPTKQFQTMQFSCQQK